MKATFDTRDGVIVPRELVQRCLESMRAAVLWAQTGNGRPPQQTCLLEIEELEAILQPPRTASSTASDSHGSAGLGAQAPRVAAPFGQGDWVATRVEPGREDSTQMQIAKVKEAYPDPLDRTGGSWLLDLVFYGRDGTKIGRESPAMGGPTRFEPACPAELWSKIAPPDFAAIRERYGPFHDLLTWLDAPSDLPA